MLILHLLLQGGDDGSHGNDDVTSYPQPIVESVSLLVKTRRTLSTPSHTTAPGVVNYKKFRKVHLQPACIAGTNVSLFPSRLLTLVVVASIASLVAMI